MCVVSGPCLLEAAVLSRSQLRPCTLRPPSVSTPRHACLGGEPGLEETEATSPIWQGSDSCLPQAPKIESYFSFQLLRGEAQSMARGRVAAEYLPQSLPTPFCQALPSCALGPLLSPGNCSLSWAPKTLHQGWVACSSWPGSNSN